MNGPLNEERAASRAALSESNHQASENLAENVIQGNAAPGLTWESVISYQQAAGIVAVLAEANPALTLVRAAPVSWSRQAMAHRACFNPATMDILVPRDGVYVTSLASELVAAESDDAYMPEREYAQRREGFEAFAIFLGEDPELEEVTPPIAETIDDGWIDPVDRKLLERVEETHWALLDAFGGMPGPDDRLEDLDESDPKGDAAHAKIDALASEATNGAVKDYHELLHKDWWIWPEKGVQWNQFLSAARGPLWWST